MPLKSQPAIAARLTRGTVDDQSIISTRLFEIEAAHPASYITHQRRHRDAEIEVRRGPARIGFDHFEKGFFIFVQRGVDGLCRLAPLLAARLCTEAAAVGAKCFHHLDNQRAGAHLAQETFAQHFEDHQCQRNIERLAQYHGCFRRRQTSLDAAALDARYRWLVRFARAGTPAHKQESQQDK